jgi:hypothetical protein
MAGCFSMLVDQRWPSAFRRGFARGHWRHYSFNPPRAVARRQQEKMGFLFANRGRNSLGSQWRINRRGVDSHLWP